MKTAQLARLVHTAGMRDDADLVLDLVLETGNPLGLVGNVEPALSFQMTGEARDAEAANHLADVVRGVAAIAALSAANNPDLKELASAVSVTTDEHRVHLNARFPWELLDKLMSKAAEAGAMPGHAPPS